ncbi:hypothetical protein KC725_02800 [Candidatus Peregrinibacteria bacterium]|nr:hypothetical protein [Candidatus Peregrinibacteria bacterium]
MTVIQSHLKLYQRNWLSILFITLVVTAAFTQAVVSRSTATHAGTIFLSIGTKNATDSTSFDDFQAADQFTESVQGWFRNPDLLTKIAANLDQNKVSISARKQEKQNLVLTYVAKDEQSAKKIGEETIVALDKEIQDYNANTGKSFTIALSSTYVDTIPDRTMIFIAMGLILGIVAAIILTYVYEFLFGFTSFPKQVEQTLQKEATTKLVGELQYKNPTIIYISSKPKKAAKNTLAFPLDTREILKEKKEVIVIARLGKSKIQDLKNLKPLLPPEYVLVTEY